VRISVIKGVGALTAVASIFNAGQVISGPPFATDDPEPTDYQHFELYVAYQQTRTVASTDGTLPQVELNYGAAPNLQLGIAVPLAFSRSTGSGNQSGIGDIAFSAKYRFLQETNNRPMAAFFPSITLATGNADRGLGAGATQIYLPIWLQKSLGPWQSYGGGGYLIDHQPGTKNHWFFGFFHQSSLQVIRHLIIM